jgi:EAL domain-containing protein (putative c-di-GMP-specific phosphodiesterase class I)
MLASAGVPAAVLAALGLVLALFILARFGSGVSRLWSDRACDAAPEHGVGKELRAAIRHGQIVPYYQPIVRLATGELIGFECIARWLHPTRGVILPDEFMPLAERAGLLDMLTRTILARVCTDAKAWPQTLTISIKLRLAQLGDEPLARMILRIVSAGHFAPSRLIIEITDAGLLADPHSDWPAIAVLRGAGVRSAIDDFGIGHARLRQLPFDRIKLNKKFVEQMEKADHGDRLAEVLALGRALDLPITAEGVESAATAEMLARFGCDAVQGDLFGEPLSYYRARNLADVLTRVRNPDAMRLAGPR